MIAPAAPRPIKPLPGTKYGPAVAVVVSLTAVATFIRWQLQVESRTMDRMFAQYQNPQSEASRQKIFGEMGQADPRRSLFNVLSWGKEMK
ncbi:hypothetical protein M406DRAFT_355390 [Cryphonectria parasitica EP155]|uniref:Uncharacterized protein n=1 Tax=Cryphonectria parasitica (strain ATCC 38755 / EP155) TaxID=660469 RepID=A0A9P4Y5H7_CRYP1|nr:uncharacterized protein M406DRAFT_355390 [Cryphonectria parasitica EP155]KAF3766870.1 hypothetical protein M406DRAFT_355390 [Cryphonectria parasitica EP155]